MDMMEQMVELIQQDLDEIHGGIDVEYDGDRWFTFEGRYVRVMVEVYSEYDTFNFGEISLANTDYIVIENKDAFLDELKVIFDTIKDNDGVTVLTEEE